MLKKIAKGLLIFMVLLLLIYLAGVFIFTRIFLPNTRINGKDFSLVEKSQFAKEYEDIWQTYDLRVVGKNGRVDIIKAKDFSYVETLETKKKIEQEPYYWFITSFVPKDYKIKSKITYDEEKFEEIFSNLHVVKDEDIKEPVPARIGYEPGKGYVILPADPGDKVDLSKLRGEIFGHFNNRDEKLDLEKNKVYVEASESENAEKMKNHVKSLNEIEAYALSYNFSDRIENLAGQDLIALHSQDEKGFLKPDKEKIKVYVENLAKKYDTFKSTRDFNITGGGRVRILGGIYGWLMDQEKTVEELIVAIEKKETQELKPVYDRTAMSRNVNDIGNSYIEIDIARQHMWLYKDGNLVIESPVVTGDPTKGNSTPTGTGVVWSREEGRYLTGDTWKSWVDYWMPFNWSGCGVHDSTWRSSYGGNIYRGNGSHGCVNTPPGKAKTFYQESFMGMPVVVYNSQTQKI